MPNQRLYSLFKVEQGENGRKKYTRAAGVGAFPKETAILVFQNNLIYGYSIDLEGGKVGRGIYELRPIK